MQISDTKEVLSVKGALYQTYTDGVICAKVSRYKERLYHPERLTTPMRRIGRKGENKFEKISWDEALAEIVFRFSSIEATHGAKSIWLYYFAGTMGLLMRDGINRLCRAKGYSGMHGTICVTPSWTGFKAGTGLIAGVDPREMAESDCVVLWGTNPVSTQVNVMRHAVKARKTRGAKIVHIDVYHNATSRQADMALIIRPGTDAALACAVMHILFRDDLADLDYLANMLISQKNLLHICNLKRHNGLVKSPVSMFPKSKHLPRWLGQHTAPIFGLVMVLHGNAMAQSICILPCA